MRKGAVIVKPQSLILQGARHLTGERHSMVYLGPGQVDPAPWGPARACPPSIWWKVLPKRYSPGWKEKKDLKATDLLPDIRADPDILQPPSL